MCLKSVLMWINNTLRVWLKKMDSCVHPGDMHGLQAEPRSTAIFWGNHERALHCAVVPTNTQSWSWGEACIFTFSAHCMGRRLIPMFYNNANVMWYLCCWCPGQYLFIFDTDESSTPNHAFSILYCGLKSPSRRLFFARTISVAISWIARAGYEKP